MLTQEAYLLTSKVIHLDLEPTPRQANMPTEQLHDLVITYIGTGISNETANT